MVRNVIDGTREVLRGDTMVGRMPITSLDVLAAAALCCRTYAALRLTAYNIGHKGTAVASRIHPAAEGCRRTGGQPSSQPAQLHSLQPKGRARRSKHASGGKFVIR